MSDEQDDFTIAMEAFERFRQAGNVYGEQLKQLSVTVMRTENVVERQQTYRDMRAALSAFVAFVNALDKTVGREMCREAFPDVDYWCGYHGYEGQAQVLLQCTCDCCGRPLLARDLLGREQYVIGPFRQACSQCMAILQPAYLQTSARLARLRAVAEDNPYCLAPAVVAAIEYHGWEVDDLERVLNLSSLQVMQLCLFPTSALQDWNLGLSILATVLPCNVEKLRAVLVAGVQKPNMEI